MMLRDAAKQAPQHLLEGVNRHGADKEGTIMKLLMGQLIYIFSKRKDRNVRMLVKFMLILVTMITIYSILFHFLMILEDQRFSWITGFYWALPVM